ncbi:MAG: glycosyltransferase [Candidatus Eremiobacteraeota bacterium]|nr:glycosyltransferase [Candidatus Eremiobacteraeota bacterium]MCW5867047.1 glycosyltransferase [Candidatus Eremiobacteraeota bacterium]
MIIVVVPAYNEEANVGRLLEDLADGLGQLMPNSRVTIALVDDGSADSTFEVAEQTRLRLEANQPLFRCVLLRHEKNRGLAEAIKTGLLYACDIADDRDIITTMDCDNSHTPGLLVHLTRKIFEGYDVAVASRYRNGSRIIGLTLFRQLLSWGASILLRSLMPIPGIRDYTCGFRAYRASCLKRVVRENPTFVSESGFSVMLDILLKMYRHDPHLAFVEIPILLRYDWKKGASKLRVGPTIRQTLRLVARRRLGQWDD